MGAAAAGGIMTKVFQPVLALGLVAALAFSLTPSVAQAASATCSQSVSGTDAPPEDIQRERQEATRQAREVADRKHDEANRRHDELTTMAKDMLTEATKNRRKADSQYARRATPATYSKMVWAKAKYGETQDISQGLTFVARQQLKVERLTINRSLEVTIWAFNTRAFVRAQEVPDICRQAHIQSAFELSQAFAPLFDALVAPSAEEFEVLLRAYGKRVIALYGAEARTLVDYEKAVRTHRASPTGPNRLARDQAKFARDEAVANRKRFVPVMRREFVSDARSLHDTQVQKVATILSGARQRSSANSEALIECVCSRQRCT